MQVRWVRYPTSQWAERFRSRTPEFWYVVMLRLSLSFKIIISGEQLGRGSNRVPDARLDFHALRFWENQRSAFFDVRVFHPSVDWYYRDLELKQIYRNHENEKKHLYSRRVLDIKQGTFTSLIFMSMGGMGKECLQYHSRLAQLISIKKGEDYAKTISWIKARTSFALLSSVLICLRGELEEKPFVILRTLILTLKSKKEP